MFKSIISNLLPPHLRKIIHNIKQTKRKYHSVDILYSINTKETKLESRLCLLNSFINWINYMSTLSVEHGHRFSTFRFVLIRGCTFIRWHSLNGGKAALAAPSVVRHQRTAMCVDEGNNSPLLLFYTPKCGFWHHSSLRKFTTVDRKMFVVKTCVDMVLVIIITCIPV